MLSKQAKVRIARNKRVRRHLWECRKRYGLNRAQWPSPWTIAYNRLVEREPIVFSEAFYPTLRIEPDPVKKQAAEDWLIDNMYPQVTIDPKEVTYTTAYHRQAEWLERNNQIQAIMQMPKAIDYPGLRERIRLDDPRHPLNFAKLGWSPEVTMILPLNGTQELKVVPKHRHHHWPAWAYEERRYEDRETRQGTAESGHASGGESPTAGPAGTPES